MFYLSSLCTNIQTSIQGVPASEVEVILCEKIKSKMRNKIFEILRLRRKSFENKHRLHQDSFMYAVVKY